MESILRIHLMSLLRITLASETISLTSPPLIGLIGYLALYVPTGRAVTRSKLAGILFPDQSEAYARRLLSESLYRLRRLLGEQAGPFLRTQGEQISLNPVWTDVNEFRSLAASNCLEDWQAAVELYSGDLLEDLDTEWVEGLRADLHDLYLSTLERSCAACIEAGELSKALSYTHRWTLADPLREEAHWTAMKLYVRLGRHAAALEQFNRLSRLLADELQVEPMLEIANFASSIRAGLKGYSPEAKRRTFVGRRRERAKLLDQAEKAQARSGQVVLVEGEPGIGKTRLLEDVTDGATWRRLSVVWGCGNELGGRGSYTPLTGALQAALAGLQGDQVRARLSAPAAQALSGLFPHGRGGELFSVPGTRKPDLTKALAECLRALAEVNTYLFILDDVQWAGADFWEVLPTLIEQTQNCRLLWILSYRKDELQSHSAAWDTMLELDRKYAPLRIHLAGIGPAECTELALEFGQAMDVQVAQQLCEHTGGNPLFLLEALTRSEHGVTSFQDLLEARLTELPIYARSALEAGAVLGREITYGRWQALAGKELLDSIPILIAARFIQESERGYLIQHDLTREHIYRSIPPGRLRGLHLAAAEALGREGARPDELAWHFEQAESWFDAVNHLLKAGDRATNEYAYTTALEHFNHGISLLPHLAQPEVLRLALLFRRQEILGILLRMTEWHADVEEIEQIAAALNDSASMLGALEARLNLQAVDGDLDGMLATGARALNLARELSSSSTEARLALAIGRHLRAQTGLVAQAIPYLQRAVELVQDSRNYPLLASTLCQLSATQVRVGQCAAAHASAARALAIIEQQPDLHPLRPDALHRLAEVSHNLGEWEVAWATLRQAMQQQFSLGKLWELGEMAFEFIITCAEMGQYQEALQTVEFVLAMAAQTGIDLEHAAVILRFRLLAAYALIQAGDLKEAERELRTCDYLLKEPVEKRAVIECLFLWGLLRLAQGRPEEAVSFLARTIELSHPDDLIFEMVITLLGYALALCRVGDQEGAKISLAQAEQILARSDAARYNVLLNFTRFQIYGSLQYLQTARDEIQRQAALFTNPRLRSDFLDKVYWNRDVEASWLANKPNSASVWVLLARLDAPLGRPLTSDERVEVQWTVDDGEADAETLLRAGKAALRQRRARRLLSEAQAQGAVPTDADLARALSVTERTIRRDMLVLMAERQSVSTRKRRRKGS